jgi:hypothetical protein
MIDLSGLKLPRQRKNFDDLNQRALNAETERQIKALKCSFELFTRSGFADTRHSAAQSRSSRIAARL